MNEEVNPLVAWLMDTPLRIALIIVGAVVLVLVLRWIVGRVVKRLARLSGSSHMGKAQVAIGGHPQRLGQRLRTFQSVINSTITAVAATVVLLMVLSELGLDVRPLLASAGVAGIALAFGAQSLVQDVVSGLFMLAEDQYGVGDRVELGGAMPFASGTVERVALRVTTLRDDDGRLWHVRNGEILRVANETQGWAVATAEIRLDPTTDLNHARQLLLETSADMVTSEGWQDVVLAEPTVLVEDITASYLLLRWSLRTRSGMQWDVASAFRRRLAQALKDQGIELSE